MDSDSKIPTIPKATIDKLFFLFIYSKYLETDVKIAFLFLEYLIHFVKKVLS